MREAYQADNGLKRGAKMTPKRRKIILVDDNEANLTMGKNMLKTFHEIFPVNSAARMFSLLEKFVPDLILLDIEMPEMDGYEALTKLKADESLQDIPVIFLTSKIDEGSELKGLGMGAVDYIYKPFSASLLLRRIDNHLLIASQKLELKNYSENLEELVSQKTSELMNLQDAILDIVAEIVEYRDDVTGSHINRTTRFFQLLLDEVIREGLYADETSEWNLPLLVSSTQLHDVGKVAIPDAILNKPGKLTADEYETMKSHAQIGVDMIDRIEKDASTPQDFLCYAKTIAGTHHEKWDGSGYPLGLREEWIPLEGRIMALADVYDALIARLPYKDPMPLEEANRIIFEGRGTHFDPLLVDVFSQLLDEFAEVTRTYAQEFQQDNAASAPAQMSNVIEMHPPVALRA
jgi:putative two-component system response regulator